jgi:hypothetical protein
LSLNPSGNLKPTGSNFSAAIIAPNILYTGAENQELVSTSRNLGGSTLACRISAKHSARLSITLVVRKFPLSLINLAPAASSFIMKVFCPIAANRLRRFSIDSLGPADTMKSLPAAAASGRPKTATAIVRMFICVRLGQLARQVHADGTHRDMDRSLG